MSKATDTLRFLAIHNSWRRGDETFGMQDPAEIGAAIDDAVNLLRRYDELEKENASLREDSEMLNWLLDNCSTFVTVDNSGGEPEIYIIEATREAVKAEVKKG